MDSLAFTSSTKTSRQLSLKHIRARTGTLSKTSQEKKDHLENKTLRGNNSLGRVKTLIFNFSSHLLFLRNT